MERIVINEDNHGETIDIALPAVDHKAYLISNKTSSLVRVTFGGNAIIINGCGAEVVHNE